MNILKFIQNLLDENNIVSTLLHPSSDVPYERLIVDCVDEKDDLADLLEITALPQNLPEPFVKHRQEKIYIIQFQFTLPLEIPPENFNQVSTTLHFFNRLLHCPGFELDEISDCVIYRYVWFTTQHAIDFFLLSIVLENIQLCFKMFNPYIKDIAAGKYTLEDILEQVVQLNKQLSTK